MQQQQQQQQALHQLPRPSLPPSCGRSSGEAVVPPDWTAAGIKYVVTRRCQGDHVGFALIGRVTAQDALAVLGPALDHTRR